MTNTLMTSVSGVRGIVGKDLTPEVVVRFATAFGRIALRSERTDVVLARDARTSGPMFASVVRASLQAIGLNVIDCGLVPTPTAQLAVEHHGAAGGIIITASHNPVEWNALKFVGADGLFLGQREADWLMQMASGAAGSGVPWDRIGVERRDGDAVKRHIEGVLALPLLDVDRIRDQRFTVALDCVRGAGGTIMPKLLEQLGCRVIGMDLETDGRFSRAPEPIPDHLKGLAALVLSSGADVGMAVDPDVDRLALVDQDGRPIGEDYTLAFAVRAVLQRQQGPVVVNLSTSLLVDDAAKSFGVTVGRAPVGEANVARAMREANAVIGGEGNGGVILPALHLGRDAPVAAALVLALLASSGKKVSDLVAAAPRYVIVKAKVPRRGNMDGTYIRLESRFADAQMDRQDGLRVAWADRWLHVRPSGTEPIVRIIAEAPSREDADGLIQSARKLFEGEQP